jgi:signal transduction histidine kinase
MSDSSDHATGSEPPATDEHAPPGDDGRVSLAAVPSPAARYVVEDDTAVIEATNDAFDTALGEVPPGTTVAEWATNSGLTTPSTTTDALAAAVAAGETVAVDQVYLDGVGPARFRATPDGEDGVIVLTGVASDAGTAVAADRIASVVSHDLRNPLDVALEAARAASDDETVHEHVTATLDAHDRMERIIEDVLTLARGEGAVEPTADVAVDRVARDAWDTVETRAATLVVADDLPTVRADPDRLRRLFENLYRNCVEHGTDTPEDTVEVRVAPRSAGAGFVVADDGPGIDPDDRERAFVPGYSSTDRGTGLGLTIVERIAEAHGWTVALGRSDAGGTRVELRLAAPGD